MISITAYNKLTTDQKKVTLQTIWRAVMPAQIEPLDEITLIIWLTSNRPDDIECAIRRAGQKMHLNIAKGIPLIEDAATRYAGSVLGNRTWYRKNRCTEPTARILAHEMSLER